MNNIYPNRPRKFGDHYDAFRIHNADPFFAVIPHIMRNRTGSMVFFEESIEITNLEEFAKRLRRETSMTDISLLHLVMAATVRIIAMHPCLNRYVAGRRLYARNHISLSIAVKNTMTEAGSEATLKLIFSPTDSLEQIWQKIHDGLSSIKDSADNNSTFRTASILRHIPVFALRFFIFLMRHLDQMGKMPKKIYEVSPFHASAFIVDIGSTGIDSIYHHLYDFGNCPVFISIGRKTNQLKADRNGNIESVRAVNFRFVIDERICDGYYYAKAMVHLKRIFQHPETLLTPLDSAMPDPQLDVPEPFGAASAVKKQADGES